MKNDKKKANTSEISPSKELEIIDQQKEEKLISFFTNIIVELTLEQHEKSNSIS
ncbi:hypothetical protein [Sinomicrobium weinanense]|uniref:Uncharacterized protein n=1 Tax=Sinomicrobium weinanense TaxID=2842200 RepID=A0A926JQ04_9FLAO|nr:hypothetical protein [Sinomicrobium weinanense]MBC9795350.1 hypothetical protein [Sinomicrobium weinanense]MBU3122935.1 hypothetical protein [Sinomicrobium weinanense]